MLVTYMRGIMQKTAIGNRIRELRKSKGYTQAQLAEYVGIHEKHISRLESGKYFPSFESMIKIFKVLDYDLNSILCKTECVVKDNPVKKKILKIINNASERELKFFLGILNQSAKSLKEFENIP